MANRIALMIPAVIVGALGIPLILRRVPPNGIYGLRTPFTQSSPDVWYPANAFGGWAIVVAAVVCVGVLWGLPASAPRWLEVAALAVPVLVAAAVSLAYVSTLGS